VKRLTNLKVNMNIMATIRVATGQTIIKVTTMVMVNVKAMAIITIGQIISIVVGEMAAVVTNHDNMNLRSRTLIH
ncbi:hypothetical protein NL521_29035, partial [Klebsiella pneumoniae]|nr:hypothetical protein [Klebsiella pneumoniae]